MKNINYTPSDGNSIIVDKDKERKVLIDEIVENSHFSDISDVLIRSMEFYAENNKGTNYTLIINSILARMKEDNPTLMNEKEINQLLNN